MGGEDEGMVVVVTVRKGLSMDETLQLTSRQNGSRIGLVAVILC